MKQSFVIVLAFCFVLSLSAFAQDTSKDTSSKDTSKDAANTQTAQAAADSLNTVYGTIKAEGDKLTFVSDIDQKSWDVQNPATLKGYEGQHVQLQVRAYPDKSSIQVMGVQLKDKAVAKTDEVKK